MYEALEEKVKTAFKNFLKEEVFQRLKIEGIEMAVSKPTAKGLSFYGPVYEAGFIHGAYIAIGIIVAMAKTGDTQEQEEAGRRCLKEAQAIREGELMR